MNELDEETLARQLVKQLLEFAGFKRASGCSPGCTTGHYFSPEFNNKVVTKKVAVRVAMLKLRQVTGGNGSSSR